MAGGRTTRILWVSQLPRDRGSRDDDVFAIGLGALSNRLEPARSIGPGICTEAIITGGVRFFSLRTDIAFAK